MMLVNPSNVVSGEDEMRRNDFPSANMLQIKNQKEVPIVFAPNLINLSAITMFISVCLCLGAETPFYLPKWLRFELFLVKSNERLTNGIKMHF